MRRNARAVAPFFELGGIEKPVAGGGQGDLDIVPARVAVCEAEGPKAIWLLRVVSLLVVRCDGRQGTAGPCGAVAAPSFSARSVAASSMRRSRRKPAADDRGLAIGGRST